MRMMVSIWRVLMDVMREIFDEAAYERFLHRAGVASSSTAYATFRREFDEGKVRRPRCC